MLLYVLRGTCRLNGIDPEAKSNNSVMSVRAKHRVGSLAAAACHGLKLPL
ncbi:TPA: hypothetical protein KW045_004877 [Escherichia coli]|nr:hypothetical protein [Escherichia coli]